MPTKFSPAESINNVLNLPILPIGNTEIPLWVIVFDLVLAGWLYYISGILRRSFIDKVLAKTRLEIGTQQVLGTILRGTIIAAGLLIIMDSLGVHVTSLTVLAGALGIGLSLGLQSLTKNAIAGLVILLEKNIKIGDHIQFNGFYGKVERISLQSTIIRNNDNCAVIIPNSELTSTAITNKNFGSNSITLSITIKLASNTSPERLQADLQKLLVQIAGVNKEPLPDVFLQNFADGAYEFLLRFNTTEFFDRSDKLKSEVLLKIYDKLHIHEAEQTQLGRQQQSVESELTKATDASILED